MPCDQIIVDHNTAAGFESVIEAREYLLRQGRNELTELQENDEEIKGLHVVAPVRRHLEYLDQANVVAVSA